jgi:tRNA pseudouridine13 synthase
MTTGLPLATADLPGTGGSFKADPADFVVEELALYEPGGAGEHVYLRHRRSGMTTPEVAQRLARLFGLREFEVGYAGLKDRQARAEQTFSLPLPRADVDEVAKRVAAELPGTLVWARRHANKLRRGHLIGNRFTALVRAPGPDALSRARVLLAALAERGMPNLYGLQRTGGDGRNAARGRERLSDPRRDWLANLQRTAWQAQLFNAWLARRAHENLLARVVAGDVAKTVARGGLFDVVDEPREVERAARGEIVATGPLCGARMRRASGRPGEVEDELLAASGLTWEALERSRLVGSRRAARVFPGQTWAEAHGPDLELGFTLPKGSYATVLLHEVTRTPCEARAPELEPADAGD